MRRGGASGDDGAESAARALTLLEGSESVCDIVHLAGVGRCPEGDLILCDVAREDASVLLADLRELGIERDGAIAIDSIGTLLSKRAAHAVEVADGSPEDAVVWEQVEATTSESATLSASFVIFIVLAGLIASVGIYLDSAILIVGAMVVGPEFGPIAGFCVAAVQRRGDLAGRSLIALLAGFPAAIAAAANIGVSAAYSDWAAARGSAAQLLLNLLAILLAGTLTLALERALYRRRRRRHLHDPARAAALSRHGRRRR